MNIQNTSDLGRQNNSVVTPFLFFVYQEAQLDWPAPCWQTSFHDIDLSLGPSPKILQDMRSPSFTEIMETERNQNNG